MCGPLRDFVKSVQHGETRIVEFLTSWGANFKDSTEPAIFAKRCNHYGYPTAINVCAYLMQHGAIEFSNTNLERAVVCLSPKTRIGPHLSLDSASISIRYGTDDRGSHVNIEFSENPKIGGMILKISADGY